MSNTPQNPEFDNEIAAGALKNFFNIIDKHNQLKTLGYDAACDIEANLDGAQAQEFRSVFDLTLYGLKGNLSNDAKNALAARITKLSITPEFVAAVENAIMGILDQIDPKAKPQPDGP